MGEHEDKVEILGKYLSAMTTAYNYHLGKNVSGKKLDNAEKSFAQGLDREKVLGFYDVTVLGSGKKGFLFTDDKLYATEMFEKNKKYGMTILKRRGYITQIRKTVIEDWQLN